ncbi:hypothetical protein [Nostoc sp. 106C]|uniref:hypothetical protein n=1 Tax=Nostoc sp. 106C TaxID=1932667 RepID=UPI000A3725F4|nr:hypothetical protein [Nostoc sp. 106C]OUL22052.1 hypothetical protein BV375_28115 [Nostoc sp. 106C]
MGQQIKKICQHKSGELWTDGCCTQNPPVDDISIKSHAIASTFEQSPTTQTEVQRLAEATAG